jgi:large subunit ribosomal protein L23Ae
MKIEENNTLEFIVDVKANKHQIKQAVKLLYDIDMGVNNLIIPDEEKAHVGLIPDYNALDVVNKIGMLLTESSWLIINIHFFTIKIFLCLFLRCFKIIHFIHMAFQRESKCNY